MGLFHIQASDLLFSNTAAREQAIAVAKAEDDGCVANDRILICEVRDRVRAYVAVLKARRAVIRQANAALLSVTLERLFAGGA
jgi:hypothetical protein